MIVAPPGCAYRRFFDAFFKILRCAQDDKWALSIMATGTDPVAVQEAMLSSYAYFLSAVFLCEVLLIFLYILLVIFLLADFDLYRPDLRALE